MEHDRPLSARCLLELMLMHTPALAIRLTPIVLLFAHLPGCAEPATPTETVDEHSLEETNLEDGDPVEAAGPPVRTHVIWSTGFERPLIHTAPYSNTCGSYSQKRISTATEFVGWEYKKTLDGYIEFPTDVKYRGNNALQMTYPAIAGPDCDPSNSNKEELATLNVLSQHDGKLVYNFGYTRYTGFAVRFGDSLNPASPRFFGNSLSQYGTLFAQIRQDSSNLTTGPILSLAVNNPKSTANAVLVEVTARSDRSVDDLHRSTIFSFWAKKAQWYSVVLETTFNSRGTGKFGAVRLWLDGQQIEVAPDSLDERPLTRFRWDGYIGFDDLADPANSSSGLFFDIYRARQAVAQTVFFDNVRVTAASNDRPSFEARMLADPRKLGRRAGSDIDGDGISDRITYASGRWSMLKSSGGVVESTFGGPGDKPFVGDYDGDGLADRVVYRPGNATWYIRYANGVGDSAVAYGLSTDKPVRGDFDGDGILDRAVYRPATGEWWARRSSDGVSVRLAAFGLATDVPVPGDFDGDSVTDLAVWRPTNGTWYVRRSNGDGDIATPYGASTDVPVAADYDGDGKTDRMIFRAGAWYLVSSATGGQSHVANWGLAGDVPAAGDYDGDGKTDLAIYRPSTATFWVIRSSNGQSTAIVVGAPGASVIPSP